MTFVMTCVSSALCVVLLRGGEGVTMKPELQRALESRKRDQLIKQRKQEDEARKKISPLEEELLKRHKKLDEVFIKYSPHFLSWSCQRAALATRCPRLR